MASASRASWVVAASISAVETLKDQVGLCRWNYAMRSLHHKAKKELAPLTKTSKMSPSSSSSLVAASAEAEKARSREESLRKVMYLSCWGPN